MPLEKTCCARSSLLAGTADKTRMKYHGVCATCHARSSFVYYLPYRDLRSTYRDPTDHTITALAQELAPHFGVASTDANLRITRLKTHDEVRFRIHYRRPPARQASIRHQPATASHTVRREESDFVAYNTVHGTLRMSTTRASDRANYRLAFGKALFGIATVFAVDTSAISLEPLKGHCRGIFNCADIDGLVALDPVEIAFHRIQAPDRQIVLQTDNHGTLWDSNHLVRNLVPDDADTIRHIVCRYQLGDSPAAATFTVNQGRTIQYERERDAPIIEKFLWRRRILRALVAVWTWVLLHGLHIVSETHDLLPDWADNLLCTVT